jgi:hypothetical protein
MIYTYWNERESEATVKHRVGAEGGPYNVVYEVGDYQVTLCAPVPGETREDPKVTYAHRRRGRSDPRDVMPNIEVQDGALVIPLEDLVGEVLKRMSPAEVAQALLKDAEVREQFVESLVSIYSSDDIGDKERRALLVGVKEAVHSTEVAALASKMAEREFYLCKNVHHWDQVRQINQLLKDRDIRSTWVREGETVGDLIQFKELDTGRDELAIGGKAWNESRDYWREKMAELFPGPKAEES